MFLNPVALVDRFRVPKRVLPKFMTTEELKQFFPACDEDERRLFMSILLSGIWSALERRAGAPPCVPTSSATSSLPPRMIWM